MTGLLSTKLFLAVLDLVACALALLASVTVIQHSLVLERAGRVRDAALWLLFTGFALVVATLCLLTAAP